MIINKTDKNSTLKRIKLVDAQQKEKIKKIIEKIGLFEVIVRIEKKVKIEIKKK
jgi:hypothetical protein